jgi:hypothetical protein
MGEGVLVGEVFGAEEDGEAALCMGVADEVLELKVEGKGVLVGDEGVATCSTLTVTFADAENETELVACTTSA